MKEKKKKESTKWKKWQRKICKDRRKIIGSKEWKEKEKYRKKIRKQEKIKEDKSVKCVRTYETRKKRKRKENVERMEIEATGHQCCSVWLNTQGWSRICAGRQTLPVTPWMPSHCGEQEWERTDCMKGKLEWIKKEAPHLIHNWSSLYEVAGEWKTEGVWSG